MLFPYKRYRLHIKPTIAAGLEHWRDLYIPPVEYSAMEGLSIAAYATKKSPSPSTVYNALGIPICQQLQGLQIIPDPPGGGRPRCSLSTLVHLALINSPWRCMLGYEIMATLMGYFHYYRYTTEEWKVCHYTILKYNTLTCAVTV